MPQQPYLLADGLTCELPSDRTLFRKAIALSQNPSVLLLDEPTNHLDYQGLEELRRSLQTFPGAFVIVSHKPLFLDQVAQTIWELTPDELDVYGGNFSAYREQKQRERDARERSHEVARKQLRQAKASAMREQQRAAQSQRNGHLQADSMPTIVAGAYKRKAEVTAGKQKLKHEKAVAIATQKVAETKVKTTKATVIQLEERSHNHRNLLEIPGASLWIGDRLLVNPMQFQLRYGDRVAIAGTNGSGKSSLIRAILGYPTEAMLKSGEVLLAPNLSAAYLDQSYELVDRQRTVLENMQSANPSLEYQLVRQQLGHFLFGDRIISKSTSALSGGELARLVLAMISVSAIDLLILDEPSNNLDITTVNQMVNAMNDYKGALAVIFHDVEFLSRIRINRAFKIHRQRMERTIHLPVEIEQYYRELLDA